MNNDNTRRIALGRKSNSVRLCASPCARKSRVNSGCDGAGNCGCVEHGLGQNLINIRGSVGEDESRAITAVQSSGLREMTCDEQRLVQFDNDGLNVNDGRRVGARIGHMAGVLVSMVVAMTASSNRRHQSGGGCKEAVSNHVDAIE